MAEKLNEASLSYKIWKNPSRQGEPVAYLGEYPPPSGKLFFAPEDFRELGFGPGDYTVLVPVNSPRLSFASKWQRVTVPE
jgi:hypothetical protein